MKIEINLSKGECLELLEKNGDYVIEKIKAYYWADENHQDENNLVSYYVECAFKLNEKPPFYYDRHPWYPKVSEYSVENVVSKIFNKKLFEIINKL